MLGESKKSRKEPIFFRRPPDRDSFFGVKNLPDLAVRSGKWKLLCEYDGERAEFYDLTKDPSESTDLADQVPEIRDHLIKLVTTWHQSMPADNGPNLAASKPK